MGLHPRFRRNDFRFLPVRSMPPPPPPPSLFFTPVSNASQHFLLFSVAAFATPGDLDKRQENAVQKDLQLLEGDGGSGDRDPAGDD